MADLSIYDNYYFRVNKRQLRFINLWPYDSTSRIYNLLWLATFAVLCYPHFTGVVVHIKSVDLLLGHIIISLILMMIILKYWSVYVEQDKMKSVYDDIANIWSMISDEEEKKILIEYSNLGRLLTLAHMGLLASASVLFVSVPLVPSLLNAVDPLPTPRPHISVLSGEFVVFNLQDHFLQIYAWEATSVIITCVATHALDGMYMMSVEQCRALYAILAYRLSKLQYRGASNLRDDKNGSYEWMVHIIKLHQIILSFVNNINDSLSLCFIGLTVLNMVALPVSCVMVIIYLGDKMNLARWTFVLVTLILHLFVQFWPGQKISQAGYALIEDAYHNDWYETPPKTKKLLQIFMVRCSQPPLITAGGLMEMNFEVYAQVVKTAASYVTVLASFR